MPEVKSLWPGYAGAGAGPGGGEGGLAGPGGRWLWPPGRRRCGRRSICPPELGRRRAHVVLVQVKAPACKRWRELPVYRATSIADRRGGLVAVDFCGPLFIESCLAQRRLSRMPSEYPLPCRVADSGWRRWVVCRNATAAFAVYLCCRCERCRCNCRRVVKRNDCRNSFQHP